MSEPPRIPEKELVPLDQLHPHPRNYRDHPEDQLTHIEGSLREHGWYRCVVVAEDLTILAGHGLVLAARRLGLREAPVFRLPVAADSPQALKVLAGDNEVGRLAEVDDRALTELLREVSSLGDGGLLGTGFDELSLAALAMVTRPAAEIPDFDAAAEWAGAGMPAFEPPAGGGAPGQAAGGDGGLKLLVTFRSAEDRARFVEEKAVRVDKREAQTWTTRWPFTERKDNASLRFTAASAGKGGAS